MSLCALSARCVRRGMTSCRKECVRKNNNNTIRRLSLLFLSPLSGLNATFCGFLARLLHRTLRLMRMWWDRIVWIVNTQHRQHTSQLQWLIRRHACIEPGSARTHTHTHTHLLLQWFLGNIVYKSSLSKENHLPKRLFHIYYHYTCWQWARERRSGGFSWCDICRHRRRRRHHHRRCCDKISCDVCESGK